jgi:hypothetical protein
MLQVQLASALHPLHEAPELAGQERQVATAVAATVVEYVPAGHAKQTVGIVAPTTVEYVPAAQLVQEGPVVVLKVPATQAVHGPPPGPLYPMLQRQTASALQPLHEDPEFAGQETQVEAAVATIIFEYVLAGHKTQVAAAIGEYVPAAQLVHNPEPVDVLAVPASQAVQTPPLGPVNPTLQAQLASALHPLHVEPELAGQERQVALAVAAIVVEYVPTGHRTQVAAAVVENVPAAQLVHATEPVVDLKVPATQAEQTPPFGPV